MNFDSLIETYGSKDEALKILESFEETSDLKKVISNVDKSIES